MKLAFDLATTAPSLRRKTHGHFAGVIHFRKVRVCTPDETSGGGPQPADLARGGYYPPSKLNGRCDGAGQFAEPVGIFRARSEDDCKMDGQQNDTHENCRGQGAGCLVMAVDQVKHKD